MTAPVSSDLKSNRTRRETRTWRGKSLTRTVNRIVVNNCQSSIKWLKAVKEVFLWRSMITKARSKNHLCHTKSKEATTCCSRSRCRSSCPARTSSTSTRSTARWTGQACTTRSSSTSRRNATSCLRTLLRPPFRTTERNTWGSAKPQTTHGTWRVSQASTNRFPKLRQTKRPEILFNRRRVTLTQCRQCCSTWVASLKTSTTRN